MKYQINRLCSLLMAQLLVVFALSASHNTSRYFPFFERSHEYVAGRASYINSGVFHSVASTSLRSGGSTGGIPELWGNYDLRDVIDSLQAVQGVAFVNPIETVTGTQALVGAEGCLYR